MTAESNGGKHKAKKRNAKMSNDDLLHERLALLRKPFEPNQISKLPKGTKAQNECRADEKINCAVCGGWHHPRVIHLDYVGHAALTDRLLDVDPLWTWEPLAYRDGLPAFDETGGLWIKLTVCGHTRLGYGHAEKSTYKDIGSREKEVIGDALRNAAMRFGAALELWHKGDLHVPEEKKPIPESAKSVSKSVFDSMSDEEKQFITEIAEKVINMIEIEGHKQALAWLKEQTLDADERVALNSLFDSKTRSGLKKASSELAAITAAENVSE